jgi:FKBP-type peptidyl-prolyl cis-trans isomerase (trigger factor)
MLIEIKEIEDCRLNIRFEADPKQVEDKRTEVIQYFKTSKVPGFREGKATTEAISHHFRKRIDDVMKSELAQNAFQTVVAEKNIRPFGQPQFLALNLDGSKFNCDFCVNKIPEVELKEYKNFQLPKGNIPDAVEMAEKILQEL